jgi:predicted RecB family endonuclease
MYYERLALEVGATVAGFDVIKPASIRGASGVEQSFDFVAADGHQMYAFDLCAKIGQVEILRTYVKKMDTGAKTFIVCLSGRPNAETKDLARNYGIDVLSPSDVGNLFSSRISQHIRVPKNARPSRALV